MKLKQLIALLLLLSMGIFGLAIGFAEEGNIDGEETEIGFRMAETALVSGNLTLVGKKITFKGTAESINKSSGIALTVNLQQKNGNSWKNLANITKNGKGYVSVSSDKTVTNGTYRVAVTAKVNGETVRRTAGTTTVK